MSGYSYVQYTYSYAFNLPIRAARSSAPAGGEMLWHVLPAGLSSPLRLNNEDRCTRTTAEVGLRERRGEWSGSDRRRRPSRAVVDKRCSPLLRARCAVATSTTEENRNASGLQMQRRDLCSISTHTCNLRSECHYCTHSFPSHRASVRRAEPQLAP